MAVISCGHIGCPECIEELIARNPKCPICRVDVDIKAGQVMTVTIKTPKPARPLKAEREINKDIEKYGSKVFEFVNFAQETMHENHESKIILFIQFNRFIPVFLIV